MKRPRTWDLTLDGSSHVITYTPRQSYDVMSSFKFDGQTIAIDWCPRKRASEDEVFRSEFDLAGHSRAFKWTFAKRPGLLRFVLNAVQVIGTAPGNFNSDTAGIEPVDADLWLTVDGTVIGERPGHGMSPGPARRGP